MLCGKLFLYSFHIEYRRASSPHCVIYAHQTIFTWKQSYRKCLIVPVVRPPAVFNYRVTCILLVLPRPFAQRRNERKERSYRFKLLKPVVLRRKTSEENKNQNILCSSRSRTHIWKWIIDSSFSPFPSIFGQSFHSKERKQHIYTQQKGE